MKNLMSRTSYDLERELEYNRDKQTTEKFVVLDTLKKNHGSQIAVLDDQITKLKAANNYKNTEFEGQLQENKNLKQRYEEWSNIKRGHSHFLWTVIIFSFSLKQFAKNRFLFYLILVCV